MVYRVRVGPGGHISVEHQKWGSVLYSSEFKVSLETCRESHSASHRQPEIQTQKGFTGDPRTLATWLCTVKASL